jgi:hypothetical protein
VLGPPVCPDLRDGPLDRCRVALAFARGDRERAAELLRRTQPTLDSAGIVLEPDDAFEVEWLHDQPV